MRAGTSALTVSAGILLTLPEIANARDTRNSEITKNIVPNNAALDAFDSILNLNKVDFINQLGTRFELFSETHGSKYVTLTDVQDLIQKNTNTVQLDGFSLTFRGKKRQAVHQDTYIVNHETLGSFRLLLVPTMLSQSEPVLCYEAIINRVM